MFDFYDWIWEMSIFNSSFFILAWFYLEDLSLFDKLLLLFECKLGLTSNGNPYIFLKVSFKVRSFCKLSFYIGVSSSNNLFCSYNYF